MRALRHLLALAVLAFLVPFGAAARDYPAGPIWNQADAQRKCPAVCARAGRTWDGNWRTTEFGRMSVCNCVREERREACPRIYAPVCATRAGRERTFPNACEAENAGFRVRSRGPCGDDEPERPAPPERPRFCPQNYLPVCGVRRGQARTFQNDCVARAEGFEVVSRGRCP